MPRELFLEFQTEGHFDGSETLQSRQPDARRGNARRSLLSGDSLWREAAPGGAAASTRRDLQDRSPRPSVEIRGLANPAVPSTKFGVGRAGLEPATKGL